MTKPHHGHARRGRKTKTYIAWRNMVQRSLPGHPQARDYIERGITLCDRWLSFDNFLADMGECPSGLMLDRTNNELGYFPENCRWTDRFTQNRNRRRKGPQKLEVADIFTIRIDPRTCRAIAADYEVSPQQVERIKNRKRWTHV